MSRVYRVLSLLQPWASLVVTKHPQSLFRAIKEWETRSWKPSEKMMAQVYNQVILIHASERWAPAQRDMMRTYPFKEYRHLLEPMPFGAIIGEVTMGEVITSESWQLTYGKSKLLVDKHESCFGDYSPGRYAWHFSSPNRFITPIPVKGSLSLREYDIVKGVKLTKK